jgi:hypothetical protein
LTPFFALVRKGLSTLCQPLVFSGIGKQNPRQA